MYKKYVNTKRIYIRSVHGPLFFASRDLYSREIADNVLAHGVLASLVTIGCADTEASTVRFRYRTQVSPLQNYLEL